VVTNKLWRARNMTKHTLKIYDAVVDIYEFTDDEFLNANIEVEGEVTSFSILDNGVYTPASREFQSYYARGFAEDKTIYVLADYIDTKQLSNLFLALGATTAIAAPFDITKVKISEGFKKEEINLDEVVGHLAVEEVYPIEKSKKKRRK
jgi:hypothetical protein